MTPTDARVRTTPQWVATWLPAACAVHCVLTPVLVGLFPALALSHRWEGVLLASSLALAQWPLRSGSRLHGDRRVRALVFAGAALWAASILGLFAPLPETLVSPISGLTMAAALVWNGRLIHRARCRTTCGCPLPHGHAANQGMEAART